MKKAIISTLMFAAMVIVVPSAEGSVTTASVTATATSPQVYVQPRRYRRGRTRTVISTRIRWVGPYRYRETIRTTYFANGRRRSVVVRRVRLAGRRVYRNY